MIYCRHRRDWPYIIFTLAENAEGFIIFVVGATLFANIDNSRLKLLLQIEINSIKQVLISAFSAPLRDNCKLKP
jgi:hypothetical protein